MDFLVVWSHKSMDKLERMAEEPQQFGGREGLARAIESLHTRLCKEPLDVGEIYSLRGAVESHLAVDGHLAIDFAVDKKRRLVLVRDVHELFGEI